MSAEGFGRQESQNRGNSSTMRLQGDSFSTSAEKVKLNYACGVSVCLLYCYCYVSWL